MKRRLLLLVLAIGLASSIKSYAGQNGPTSSSSPAASRKKFAMNC